jgi:small multidrug resistance pump
MWIWLAAAIASEVMATLSLRASEGFTRLIPSIVVVLGYGFAFFGLSRALADGMGVGQAYAVWAGVGVAVIAVLGTVLFGDHLTLAQVAGLAMIVAGVFAVELGATSHA